MISIGESQSKEERDMQIANWPTWVLVRGYLALMQSR